MTVVSAGQLIHRIALQRATTTIDALGAPSRTWLPVKTVWASITPTEITHEITVRYLPLFSDLRDLSNYRAMYKSRIFKIHGGINEDEKKVIVTLYASEGIDDGEV